MLRADFHEGVKCAECDMQTQPLVKEPGDFVIRLPFAAKFAYQITMRLRLGAWRLERKSGQISRAGLALCICGGKRKSHGYSRRRLSPHSADDH